MTALHGNLPDVVITDRPTGTKPILLLSSCIISPPFLTMASATPPPCFRYELQHSQWHQHSSFCNISSHKPNDTFCFLAVFDLQSQPCLGAEVEPDL